LIFDSTSVLDPAVAFLFSLPSQIDSFTSFPARAYYVCYPIFASRYGFTPELTSAIV
jgi:hypothetical protein